MRNSVRIAGIVLTVACIAGCKPVEQPAGTTVTTTFYPLTYLAQQVAGDAATVRQITPMGAEPHDFEPTPADLQAIYRSSVFLYNGAGVDAWAERIDADLQANDVHTEEMVAHVTMLQYAEEGYEEEDTHDHGEGDPHVWLDPQRMQQMTAVIADALTAADAANAEKYAHNARITQALLHDLDRAFDKGLRECELRAIVVSHDAFGYLADRYNFTVHALAGLDPDADVSPSRLADIVRTVREDDIDTVFFETLVSPEVAEIVAKEAGVKTAVLNPVEGLTAEDIAAGKDYRSLMLENLAALRSAMRCQ